MATTNIQTFSGDVEVNGTTASSSKITGALTVAGGVGISGALYGANANLEDVEADSVNVTDTTTSSSTSTGALTVAGGVGIAGALYGANANLEDVEADSVNVTDTTASTSTTTGALTVAGGVGIAGSLNIGGETILGTAIYRKRRDWNRNALAYVYLGNVRTSSTTGIRVDVSLNNANSGYYMTSYDITLTGDDTDHSGGQLVYTSIGSVGSLTYSGTDIGYVYVNDGTGLYTYQLWLADPLYSLSGSMDAYINCQGYYTFDTEVSDVAQGGSAPTNFNLGVPAVLSKYDGNVGIGTANPRSTLEVYGPIMSTTNPAIYSHNLYYDTSWKYAQAGYGGAVMRMTDSEVQFWNAPNDNESADSSASPVQRVTFAENGNVGIGVANPTKSLEINGTTLRHAYEYRYQDAWTSNNNQTFTISVSGGSARGEMLVEAEVIQVAANSSAERFARVKGIITNHHTGNFYMKVLEGENATAFETYIVGTSGSASGTFTMKYQPQQGYQQSVRCRLNLKIFIGGFTSSLGSLTRTDTGSNSDLTAPTLNSAPKIIGGNVGIGTNVPSASARLDVDGTLLCGVPNTHRYSSSIARHITRLVSDTNVTGLSETVRLSSAQQSGIVKIHYQAGYAGGNGALAHSCYAVYGFSWGGETYFYTHEHTKTQKTTTTINFAVDSDGNVTVSVSTGSSLGSYCSLYTEWFYGATGVAGLYVNV